MKSEQLRVLSEVLRIKPNVLAYYDCEEVTPILYKFNYKDCYAIYNLIEERIVEEYGADTDLWVLRVLLNDISGCEIFSSVITKVIDKQVVLGNVHFLEQECFLELTPRYARVVLTKRSVPCKSFIFNRKNLHHEGLLLYRLENDHYTFYINVKHLTSEMLKKELVDGE